MYKDVNEEELPNRNAQEFFEMLKAAEEPFFGRCITHSPLLVVFWLLNIKPEFNISDNCYDKILIFMKKSYPNMHNYLMITKGLNKWLQNMG